MASLLEVIMYSLVGGVLSLVGGALLISNKNRALKLADYATPFAAGALLAAAFLDLLREASHEGSIETALQYALIGILVFFFLERFLKWFHHHHEHDEHHKTVDPTASLIIIGDVLHNFIDGIAIAAGFLVSTETGIVVTLAVAAHEIPQEIGDFGLLLKKGLSRKKVLWVNVVSALATTIAAVTFFQLGQSFELPLDSILGLVAGFFIYIATSDIIPMIHHNKDERQAKIQSLLLVIGVIVVGLVTTTLHDYIDQANHDHDHSSEASEHHDDDDEHAHDEDEHDSEKEHDDDHADEEGEEHHEDEEEHHDEEEDDHSDE